MKSSFKNCITVNLDNICQMLKLIWWSEIFQCETHTKIEKSCTGQISFLNNWWMQGRAFTDGHDSLGHHLPSIWPWCPLTIVCPTLHAFISTMFNLFLELFISLSLSQLVFPTCRLYLGLVAQAATKKENTLQRKRALSASSQWAMLAFYCFDTQWKSRWAG